MLPQEIFMGVHMYDIMIAIGILCAFLTLFSFAKKKNIDSRFTDFIFYDAMCSIAVGFASAALFQAVYNYIKNPDAGFRLGSGLTFIGGFIGGAACFLAVYFIFRRKYTQRLYRVVSVAPCCILIAHAFGRIGCFFAGCCYGKPTESFLGVRFPGFSTDVHPTQLYESAFLFALFGVCSYLFLKKDFRHNLSLYLIAYGVFRFMLEFLRGDDRGELIAALSPSQFWSVLMVCAGVALVFLMNYFYRKDEGACQRSNTES